MDITLGQFNQIPDGTFIPFKGEEAGDVVVGDCNYFGPGVRVLVGPQGCRFGDYNVVHGMTTIGGPGPFSMGHNCWFGQETWLDSSGGLTLGNGVRIGLRSHVWSHMASGEQIEGWPVVFRPTELKDNVWLIGDDVHVASGVTMHENSAALAHSTITRDCDADTVYAGTPARPTSIKLRREVNLNEKMEMMYKWACTFAYDCSLHTGKVLVSSSYEMIDGFAISTNDDRLLISTGSIAVPPNTTHFDLSTKTYTKRLTQLERDFVNFLKGNKARFVPLG